MKCGASNRVVEIKWRWSWSALVRGARVVLGEQRFNQEVLDEVELGLDLLDLGLELAVSLLVSLALGKQLLLLMLLLVAVALGGGLVGLLLALADFAHGAAR